MNTAPLNKYLLIFSFLVCSPALASKDLEREVLSRVLAELEYIESLLVIAESTEGDDNGMAFDYEKFTQDITLFRKGVSRYLAKERREPRVLGKPQGGDNVGH